MGLPQDVIRMAPAHRCRGGNGTVNRTRTAGFVLWFTGLSGAGKSTLAVHVARDLQRRGERVEILDGDEIRSAVDLGLGFSRTDRERNVRLIGYITSILARNGVIALVAAISPYESSRREVRNSQYAPFIEVFVESELEALIRRDVKGLYARAVRGELTNFSGISDPYEKPSSPEIHLRTDRSSIECCVNSVLEYLESHALIDSIIQIR